MENEQQITQVEILAALREIVGDQWVKDDKADLDSFGKDWTKVYEPAPSSIVFPSDAQQVVEIVKLANLHNISLVPSGGRTGLSGGAVAANGEVVIAFDRMNKILDFDVADRLVRCEPGVITQQLQQFATDQDLFYPVDFASSGSSQIAGNVATNAGGIKVIRYGMTRNWMAGLKVVTGNGELLDLNRGLSKNATGYDLRHLFIGSEGTLGFIVEVTVNLCNPPKDPTVLVLGLENMAAAMPVLKAFQSGLNLTAYEFFSHKALVHVMEEKGLQKPFESDAEFYALIEFENLSESDTEKAMTLFEECLESAWIVDGTISQNVGQAENLWRLREDISETISKFTPYKNDISVKVSQVPAFLDAVDNLVNESYPHFEIIWFGHIGDGNVHLNILKPNDMDAKEFFESCGKVSNWVFEIVEKFGGSVSAEHGVGLLKKPYLNYSRSPSEIEYMKAIKRVFDPNNIINPGKLIDL